MLTRLLSAYPALLKLRASIFCVTIVFLQAGELQGQQYIEPRVSQSSGLEHRAKVIGNDTRRALNQLEENATTSVGYFYESNDTTKQVFGNGVAINKKFILTAGHLFVEDGEWVPEMKVAGKIQFSRISFVLPVCRRTYQVKNISILTHNARLRPDKDLALVELASPICDGVKPGTLEALGSIDLADLKKNGSIFIPAFRNLGASKQPTKSVGYGEFVGDFYRGEEGGWASVTHTVDTEPGTSGAPIFNTFAELSIFAIVKGGADDNELNVAVMITPAVLQWVKKTVDEHQRP